jgi:ribosomal protein L16 Arg81 hydroxylase
LPTQARARPSTHNRFDNPSAYCDVEKVMFEVRGVTIEPSLAWLLQPLAVQTFLDEIWGAKHHHVKRRCAGYFDSLLQGPSAVEELLELFRREPSAVRLMRGENKKGPDTYRLDDGSLDLVRIRDNFADGYTIVLDGVERYVRPIALLCQSIEVELNFPTQVNAYITPPGSQGLVPHYDDHDVLILQIQGSKIWHLYNGANVPPQEMRRDDKTVASDGLPLPTDLRLEVGDLLYLPRGRVHEAETNSEPSVHLTVGIHAPTVLMLAIGALHSLSFHDDRLNARLPPRYLDDADVRATLGVLVRDAVRTADDLSAIAGGLAALADVLIRRGRCPPIGQISNSTAIDGQTLVRKYQPLYSRVKTVADGVALEFASLSISAAADHEAAMLFISRTNEPFRVRDLPELGEKQQIELARSLIVTGFLVRLSDG